MNTVEAQRSPAVRKFLCIIFYFTTESVKKNFYERNAENHFGVRGDGKAELRQRPPCLSFYLSVGLGSGQEE